MIAVYVRVSSDEQAKKGYSLLDQQRECLERAATNDVKVYIDDGYSGEFLDRPGLTSLREDVRDGLVDRVICLDPDRLSRKLVNSLIVSDEIEKRATLEFVNGEYADTPEGRLFFQMRGAVAEFEKAKINERMSRGRRQKARQGKVVKDPQIYGYDYDKVNCSLVVNEKESKIVKWIFDVFTDPNSPYKGINGIANGLNQMGIASKRGGQWHRQVVKQILQNSTYTGSLIQNKWNTEGAIRNRYVKDSSERIQKKVRPREEWIVTECPSIIEQPQYEYAQKLLERIRHERKSKSQHMYILSGLCRCEECGNTMPGMYRTNWGTKVYVYTDIKNNAGVFRGCGNKVKCENLERLVWKDVVDHYNEFFKPSHMKQQSKSGRTYEEVEIERIDKELSRLSTGRKRLLNLLMDEDIDESDIRDRIKKLQDEVSQLESRKEELVQKIGNNNNLALHVMTLNYEQFTKFVNMPYEEIEPEALSTLIHRIVRQVVVRKDGTPNVLYM